MEEGQKNIEVIDLWSEDKKQDTWFTQSTLDIGFRWLESLYLGFSVYSFSGKWIMINGQIDKKNGRLEKGQVCNTRLFQSSFMFENTAIIKVIYRYTVWAKHANYILVFFHYYM